MRRTHWGTVAVTAAILSASIMTAVGQDADTGSLFKRLDKNRDGQIASDEVPEEQRRLFQRLVRLGDQSGDGKLTAEEFEKTSEPDEFPNVPLNQDGDPRPDSRQRFEMLDRNKDGKVTLDEVPEPLRDRLKPLFDRSGKKELSIEDLGRFGGNGRPEPAEFFKRFDANADGKLSKSELPPEARERLAPLFERVGKDEVTIEQFQQFGERVREGVGRPGMGNPEEMFGRLDVNRDGKLTVEEAPERARPMVEAALRRAGKEVSGSLTKEEFVKNMPQGRDGARPPAGERRPEGDRPAEREGRSALFFQRLDRDSDGKISTDEAPEQLKERIGMLDTNGDGFINLDEFRVGAGLLGERMRDRAEPRPRQGAPSDGRRTEKSE
ncbi:MAG TPA: hypothetical protein VGM98_21280 [Schlesneria sp.]|jgi:Ca2+-binding EF-hand superfamily protein